MKNHEAHEINNRARRVAARKIFCGLTVVILVLALCPMIFAQAEEQTVAIATPPVDTQEGMFLTKSMPTVGDAMIAVFLIEFPDYKNENEFATVDFYEDIYFDGCSLNTWGEADSVSEFFYNESGGKLNIDGQVFDWYTAEHNREYYNDKKDALVIEAAEYYMEQGVDFSDFDANNDGVIDAVTYHFAGEHEERLGEDPWYYGVMYGGAGGSGEIGDVRFKNVVQLFEWATDKEVDMFSVICHELTHTMGMPDLYGTAVLAMFPVTDLMGGSVAYVNPYFKILLGWVDSVRIITGDIEDVRIESSENSDDFVLVTDEFNGFFDEFYIVSYRHFNHETKPAILHVDARLDDSGSSFLYSNLTYDPNPDVENAHPDENAEQSKYLFMEELSADPDFDYVLNDTFLDDKRFFGEDSVLGPNSVPSSDTHDGEYTGIRMSDFLTYDGYMTFDVAFVEDNEAPTVTTDLKDMEFKELITISFNEFIYKGDTWDSIAVTDIEGNALNATVTISYYPRHIIEITFNDEEYKSGYKLVFPEGCVKDSSGNGMEALTITTSPDDYMFPKGETVLPNVGYTEGGQRYNRNNAWADYFYHENEFTVVTITGYSNDGCDPAVEIMRLDYNGNVLSQKIVENPFVGSYISEVREMGDGSFVFFCLAEARQNVDIMFCADSEGNVRWTNTEFLNTDTYFYGYSSITHGDGMIFRLMTYMTGSFESYSVYVDPDTGETSRFADISNRQILNLSGNKLFRVRGTGTSYWEILDGDTFEVLASNSFSGNDLSNDYTVQAIHENKDGTIMVSTTVGTDYTVFLLDAELNVIKSVVVDEDSGNTTNWIGDDGFAYIKLTMAVDHDDNHYRVYRYDKNLNLIWKEDVICNFIRYFKTPAGELLAYKSMLSPDRECYIVSYESENSRKTEHEHVLKYAEGRAPTCEKHGFLAHWYCEGCGVKYSDGAGSEIITDITPYVSAATGHTEEYIPAVSASCTSTGLTRGIKCSECGKILMAQIVTDKWPDHVYVNWTVIKSATCKEEGLRESTCVGGCGLKATEVIPKSENHSFGATVELIPATCISEGSGEMTCAVCGKVESVVLPVKTYHNYGAQVVVKEATCYEDGLLKQTCGDCGDELTEVIPSSSAHKYGAQVVVKEATCYEDGLLKQTCTVCGDEITEVIPSIEGHNYGVWTVERANCLQEGSMTRTCTRCGYIDTRILPASEYHEGYGLWSTVRKATCYEDGLSMRVCETCGYEDTEPIPRITNEHTFVYNKWETVVAPTCGKSGSESITCDCGKNVRTAYLPSTGEHELSEWVVTVEPTCKRTGAEERYCDNCKYSECRDISVGEGVHTFGSWTVKKYADCLKEGSETRRCSCGEIVETRTIAISNDHVMSDYWYTTRRSTCAVMGEERRECPCGKVYEARNLPLSDEHTLGKWVTVKEPVCHDGERERSCPCGKERETEILPMKVGHRFGPWSVAGKNENGELMEQRVCNTCKTVESRVSASQTLDTDKVVLDKDKETEPIYKFDKDKIDFETVDKDKMDGLFGGIINGDNNADDDKTDADENKEDESTLARWLALIGVGAGGVTVVVIVGAVALVGVTGTVAVAGGTVALFIFRKRRLIKKLRKHK